MKCLLGEGYVILVDSKEEVKLAVPGVLKDGKKSRREKKEKARPFVSINDA